MTDIDFGAVGSQAFPGRLRNNWGAALVEPPAIRAIRLRAGDRLVDLRYIAPPRSGIPTRSVKYFCVEEVEDDSLLRQYGILTNADRRRLALVEDGRGVLHVLERAALKPLIRRPGLLQRQVRVPVETAGPWRLFSVQADKNELERRRWRHTLAYIDYGSRTEFQGGARRRGGVVSERAQVAIRKIWWAIPTMPDIPGRVAWLKGRGTAHYVPELPEGVMVLDNFLVSTPPDDLPQPRVLAAIANLTWTHAMAEVFGRRAAGDGVLQTYIRELNALLILDPRILTETQAEDLIACYDEVATQPTKDITEELKRPERQRLDKLAMTFLVGAQEADQASEAVARSLRDLVVERTTKAVSGRREVQRAQRRQVFDPDPIAARTLDLEGPPPDLLTMVGDHDPDALGNVVVTIPEQEQVTRVEVGSSLFDHDALIINGEITVSSPSQDHALALRAILDTNRSWSGDIVLPASEDEVGDLTARWKAEFGEWRRKVADRVQEYLPGATRALRRRAVLASLERQAELLPGTLQGGD